MDTAGGPSVCCRAACGRQCGRSLRCVGDSCPGAGGPWLCGWAGSPPVRNPHASAWSVPAGRPGSGSDRPLSSGQQSPHDALRSTGRPGLVREGSAPREESNLLKVRRERTDWLKNLEKQFHFIFKNCNTMINLHSYYALTAGTLLLRLWLEGKVI